LALKIGVGGAVEFTPARVGQTLHIPCSHGHIADFPVNSRMPPEAVAKKMIQKGWTIGSKLTCPEHARKKKAAPPKQREYAPGVEVKVLEALKQFPLLSRAELGDLTGHSQAGLGFALRHLLECKKIERHGAPGSRNVKYSLPGANTPKDEPMATAATSLPESTPVPTDAAREARRLATMLLEEHFDVATGRYNGGYSDKKVADESGAAVQFVAKRREEDFGPLREPAEIEEAKERLNALESKIADFEKQSILTVESWRRDLAAHRNLLQGLIRKNGWAE
jgi:hypothetical protein